RGSPAKGTDARRAGRGPRTRRIPPARSLIFSGTWRVPHCRWRILRNHRPAPDPATDCRSLPSSVNRVSTALQLDRDQVVPGSSVRHVRIGGDVPLFPKEAPPGPSPRGSGGRYARWAPAQARGRPDLNACPRWAWSRRTAFNLLAAAATAQDLALRSEEHTSELQSLAY